MSLTVKMVQIFIFLIDQWFYAVVKVRGQGGGSAPCSDLSLPCNSMSPLIESIKCYFMPK